MAVASAERTRDSLVRLAHRGLGVGEFSLAAARVLSRAVAFDGVCVMTMDPATLLPTGHVIENGLPDDTTPRLAEIELLEPDVNKFTALTRAGAPAASLSETTGGDLDRSLRHRELRRPHGFEDELRAVLAHDGGAWGGIVLMREAGRAHFDRADVRHVAAVAGALADGLRRAILLTALSEEQQDEVGPGLVLLADDDSIETVNPAAERWLAELGDGEPPGERLPFAIHAVAAQARHIAAGRERGLHGDRPRAHPVRAVGRRTRIDARARARRAGGGDPRGSPPRGAGAAHRGRVRPDRASAR